MGRCVILLPAKEGSRECLDGRGQVAGKSSQNLCTYYKDPLGTCFLVGLWSVIVSPPCDFPFIHTTLKVGPAGRMRTMLAGFQG